MKALRLFLLLAASFLTAGIFLYAFDMLPLDGNKQPVLFDDEDEMCALPGMEKEVAAEGGAVRHLA